ncbi:MAG TPA: hypothetical protein VHO01_00400 [Jatrophihabitans sp.]|nr:hypothetical protein [Jatrophihabitans sp.]
MTAAHHYAEPEWDPEWVQADLAGAGSAERFDDSDGAYAVPEPDPFAEPEPVPLRRPSLRVELGAQPAVPITGIPRRRLPPLPAPDGLADLLPDGLRRGSTITVTSSVSLLLALLGGPSRHGAWTAMVGMPAISAEAAVEAGIDLGRLAIISAPDSGWTGSSWTTAVGALLDAVDVVVARPGFGSSSKADPASSSVPDGAARRLTARARSKDAVLVLFGQQAASWPGVELKLSAQHGDWTGIGDGFGRLTRRRLLVSATGKGRSAQPRTRELWL